jgi:hypothetical protein
MEILIKIKENQSVLDVVSQVIGTAEASFIFGALNDLAITDDIHSNDILKVPVTELKKNEISSYFLQKNIELATGFPLVEVGEYGIGEMIIENNFIVR